MARRFVRHFGGRELAQFPINQRQQFIGGLGVALLNSFENLGRVANEKDNTIKG